MQANSKFSDIATITLGIVCPMANEQDTACHFVKEVLQHCRGFAQVRFFAILDRVSRDRTKDLLEQVSVHTPELCVIWAPENRCVVDAYVRGYQEAIAAGCDWILEIDAGYSHRPQDIPQFFHKMLEGYDCVFGSRFCRGGSMTGDWKRYWVSYGGSMLANLILGTKLKDMTSGFELFQRDALIQVLQKGLRSRGHFFQTEIKFYCHQFKIAEVPIQYKVLSNSVNQSVVKEALTNLGILAKERWQKRK